MMMTSIRTSSLRQRRRLYGSLTTLLAASSSLQRTAALSTITSSPSICNARNLGSSDLVVSEACLGTMTWGVQNTKEDAFQQLDYAIDQGCNFIDTAELYPVPLFIPEYRAGATEEILGQYLAKIGSTKRNELVIATKVAGYFPNSPVAAARSYPDKPIINDDGTMPDCRLDATSVKEAVHASLRRLNTDHIDLLQLHWPDRYVPAFGLMTFKHEQKRDDSVSIMETATALKELIDEGKIRYIGLSNESTFGVCEWIKVCEQLGISDKLATIQNSYSLLDRRFDSELAEACDAYNIGLLPWSVLAGGLLSGKYNKRTTAKNVIQSTSNSRYERFPDYMARWHPSSASKATLDATEEYTKIANDAGLTPSELAIAFVRSRQFVEKGSVIIGATTMDQLKENLSPFVDGKKVELDEEVLMKIDAVHMACRDPCCSL